MNDKGDANSPLAIAATASAGAAVIHAAAAGIHAEHTTLSRIFIVVAVAQAAVAIWAFVQPRTGSAAALIIVNTAAMGGWLATRLTGISSIPGLEVAEQAQLADTVAAILALVAVVVAGAVLVSPSERTRKVSTRAILVAAVVTGLLVVPGLADATTHDHDQHADDGTDDHDHDEAESDDAGEVDADAVSSTDDHDDHADDDSATGDHEDDHADHADDSATDDHADHEDDDSAADDHADHEDNTDASTAWPQPWDPTGEIDFSGVTGVSAEQQDRAEQLVADTLRLLPEFADVTTIEALGYRSIGDESSGFEHYINRDLFSDDKMLDPTAPESLVYEVDGDDRTLVSAMFIVGGTEIDDPEIVDFAGPLMQWHIHDNLCWGLDENGEPVVQGVLENPGDTCPPLTVNAGGDNPMVHVWIAPHTCGPFAALEGHGAGQTDAAEGDRADQCGAGHEGHGESEMATTTAYDPELPIDLGGIEGVTLQQQAFAENLVASTVRDLPKWADLDAVEAAGFHSIGDGATGHEHYIQWDWINDDVWLDPDYPESLVFEPQPDGSKQLVSAMFMLPSDYELEDVPDWGGDLMQWHIHGDLCFTDDPVAPRIAGLKPIGVSCAAPLIDGTGAPMIHVWVRPHECGPFAALTGVGGGQVPEGEEVLCDTAHGAH